MAGGVEVKIGGALKRFRKEFKLTQTDVANKLGILQQTYYKYETDKVKPSVEVIIKLANDYDVTTDYLLGRSDEPHPPKFSEKTLNLARAIEAMQVAPAVAQ